MVYKRKSKEFVCPHCQADFNREKSLKNHIKDAHRPREVISSPLLHAAVKQLQEDKGWK
jgi:uncharacterized C2H2 Zn-finger protein